MPSPSRVIVLRSFVTLAWLLVAGFVLPLKYSTFVTFPLIGERLMCTSSGDINTLTSL